MKIKLEGVVLEMRRVYDTYRDSYNTGGTVTHGWMAKVLFRRGALNSDPIEIPVQESDGVGLRSIVEIEMTIRKPDEKP